MDDIIMHNERVLIQRMGAYCHTTYSVDTMEYEKRAKDFLACLKALFKNPKFRGNQNQLNLPNFGAFIVKRRMITLNRDGESIPISSMVLSFKTTSEWRRRLAAGEKHHVDVVNGRLREMYPQWDVLELGFIVEAFINVLTLGLINNEGYKIVNVGNFFPHIRKVSTTFRAEGAGNTIKLLRFKPARLRNIN